MATHSSVLAWRIPGTGEPCGLPSMGSHRVEHDQSHLAAAAATTKILIQVSVNTNGLFLLLFVLLCLFSIMLCQLRVLLNWGRVGFNLVSSKTKQFPQNQLIRQHKLVHLCGSMILSIYILFLILNFYFCIGVQLINNAVIVEYIF